MKRGVWILKWGVFGILFLGLAGLLTQYLWNWLVPELFAGPQISYWQTLGLLVLSKIIFSGFGGKKGHCQNCHHDGQFSWKKRYTAKLDSLNPEDREAFKKKMMEKWCRYSGPTKESQSSAND